MGLGDMTDDAIGVESGVLHLPAEELRNAVFEPVIQQVLTLIEGQLQQSPRLEAIFLVGGFGQSNYLFRRVEETFGNRVGMIGVPPRGELAVVRGAVYFGLNPQTVTERVSRRSYGVETRMLYQPGLDPIEYSVVGADNRLFCRQRFSVYVQKGQSVKVDEVVSKNFVITYPNDTDSGMHYFYFILFYLDIFVRKHINMIFLQHTNRSLRIRRRWYPSASNHESSRAQGCQFPD